MRTHALMAAALLLVVALAACGQTVVGAARSTATRTPPAAYTAVHALRTNVFGEAPPFDHTVNDAAKVQRLYQALLALPPWRAVGGCPIDLGTQFDLTFFAGARPALRSAVKPDGCGSVLIDIRDTRDPRQSWDPAFWKTFAATFGVPVSAVQGIKSPFSGGPVAPTPDPSWPQLT